MSASRPHQLRTGKPYVVVSSDTHAAPEDLDEFLTYVEEPFREQIAAAGVMGREVDESAAMFGGRPVADIEDDDPVRQLAKRKLATFGIDVEQVTEALDSVNEERVVSGDGDGRRLQILEEAGVHAEVTYPGPLISGALSPYLFAGMATSEGLDLAWASIRAYNRWLADFCAAAPGRRAGAMLIDLHDMDKAVKEIEWARGAGLFGGVVLPGMSITNGLPGFADDYFEPFWRACEDNDMVVNLHPGFAGTPTDAAQLFDEERGGYLSLYEVFVCSRRPLWFMTLGGVFDRHPRLKVAISESGVHWVPSLVRDLDWYFDKHGYAPVRNYLEMRPREYFAKHVSFGASLMQREEAEMRDEIGLDQLMWGTDYPHMEGTFPHHREVQKHVLGGLPEEDIRRILGLNAVDLWGFDLAQLEAVAEAHGPTVDELSTQLPADEVPPSLSWSLPRAVPLAQV